MTGLSSAPTPIPQFTLAPGVPTTTPPGINSGNLDGGFNLFTNEAAQGAAGTLSYPSDIPKYILTFTISEYTRDTLNEVGAFKSAPGYPGIVLPLPSEMHDLDSVNWAEIEAGVFTGQAISNLGLAGGLVTGAVTGALQGFGGGNAGGFVGGLVGGATTGALNNAAVALSLKGVAPNQFVTLLMRGPQYKRHRFSWTLAPNNFKEADQLRQIIKTFRNGMAVGVKNVALLNAPVLWTYPKIFYLRFYPNSKFMYKFKPCVINNFAVDYAPAGKASFKRNGTGNIGDNAPAVLTMQMELIEIEYFTEGNYDDSNIPSGSVLYSNTGQTQQSNPISSLNDVVPSTNQAWNNWINPPRPPG